MTKRKKQEDYIVLLLISLLFNVTILEAGTSSPPKNLVNLYTHSPNDNLSTTYNQFQNEYQYRQSASKSTHPDRYKAAISFNTTDTLISDQPTTDSNRLGNSDYLYQDSRSMTNVPECKGRLKLNGTRGYITDGPGYYQTNLQCIWLIDSGRNNATIRIQIHQYNTECNYDFLYIFDGDSIYSPLIAALSGDIKDFRLAFDQDMISMQNTSTILSTLYKNNTFIYPNNAITNSASTFEATRPIEIRTNSGKAFIYFHSDTAQSMPGFYITYSIDACPLDCSNKGECDYTTLTCRCNPGYRGLSCENIVCPNNCTSPLNGWCESNKSCICNAGFYGTDCSFREHDQIWLRLLDSAEPMVQSRAFHQSVILNQTMWVIGGRTQVSNNANFDINTQKKTTVVTCFDTERKVWLPDRLDGITGQDHLAELSGHSVAAFGDKIFIFGGLAPNNSVLDTLSVLDIKSLSLNSIPTIKKIESYRGELVPPIGVVGHTANIVDGFMYIFLGYNPLYGYVNFIQKFNLANNSWSIVERKGSSVSGYFGHTSTFDFNTRLFYVYGGHNAHRSNYLYSFDPITEAWTFLQPGPSPRYYHSSLILNNQLILFGGNSYNISYQSDQCFQQNYLAYDLNCSSDQITEGVKAHPQSEKICGRDCWKSIDAYDQGFLKRYGHTVLNYKDDLILFGGFNGVLLNDLRIMKIGRCEAFTEEIDCIKTKLALKCQWSTIDNKCFDKIVDNFVLATDSVNNDKNCTKYELKSMQIACESRETCYDCLSTNLGCVWCGFLSQCQFNQCRLPSSKGITDIDYCFRDDLLLDSIMNRNSTSTELKTKASVVEREFELEITCKVDNCYLCNSRPHCTWQNEACSFISTAITTSSSPSSMDLPTIDNPNEMIRDQLGLVSPSTISNTNRTASRFEPYNRSLLAALTSNFLNTSPFNSCDTPCYLRRYCDQCATTKCIWCSTTEQCIDSTAYFAYYAMGQCMHYVAHMLKCPVAACFDIETCDKCLSNPKCGWLNDISNTGKGRCIEGNHSGPSLKNNLVSADIMNTSISDNTLSNWYYTSCPSCQCNGHSFCKPNSSVCLQSCQDNTEGPRCERCLPGFYGDPVNGGSCRPCRCNGHAQTCNKETGKCYCSTKGIIGHNCNRCDDKNYYFGDPVIPGNGTCYYNLTTDYQYTFNMSKPEDHYYSDINFINVPLRKDSDVDFTIACSRLALVNITSGTSYKNMRPIHTSLECGSFRLRFSHDRHSISDANYTFFVHVYKFQTPFILQIAFSQHRTFHLPQFFFTFSSCFLFFFALSGLVWKLKHEYDLYARRQRQFIEMEQMASRPFSTVLLELNGKQGDKPLSSDTGSKPNLEPTPISFEPCFGGNVGILSLFVQFPGRPNLAIGSALVTINDESPTIYDGTDGEEQTEKCLYARDV